MLRDNHPGISPTTPPYPSYPPPPHSPYLRRVSPPGSPAAPAKKCCYDQHNNKETSSYQMRDAFLCCCYTCPNQKRSNSTSLLATIVICCLVLGYTILGAFVFMLLEGGLSYQQHEHEHAVAASKSPKRDGTLVGDLRAHTVDRLWSITENLNILYRENWTRLAAEEVMQFQEALFKTLRNGGSRYVSTSNGLFYASQHRWSFSSSFLYSLTLITTIGYGSVSARTAWGKIVTIIYAFVGIPLMLLYLSTTGDVLGRSFRRLYGKLCGTTNPQKPQCPCNSNRVRVPATLCLIIILGYICSGALLFHRLENWTLLESSYFCFTTLGTIGFGDLLPGQLAHDISLCVCGIYILAGMALIAMCFTLVQDEVLHLFRLVGAKCARKERIMDEGSMGSAVS